MRTTLIGRWLEKNNKPFVALLAAGATLAMATLIDASSSSQVEQLGLLAVPRTGHAATALADGRALITGGRDSAGTIVATAEVVDPANQTSTAIGVLNTARIDHTATLLADGRVLIAGGTSANGALTSVEIFDPANPGAGFRVLSATMSAARTRHTATRLHNGTVLIAGGDAAGSAEIFNPATETFSSALLAMAAPRIGHTATLFSDDRVLLAGGNTDSMEYFSSIDQTFTLDQAKLTATRTGHDAISLSDTRLLFFGGDTGHTIDEFNTSADALSLKATMDGASSSVTLLANGKILVLRPDAAGLYAPDAADQATAFTVFDETSVPGSTALLRSGQTATELPGDKKILVAGGVNAQHQPSLQIVTFNPAKIWTDKDDYYPGESVILSGSGWKANEDVYLYAVDNINQGWTFGATETAGADGSFIDSPYFIVEQQQLGAQFTVTAVGAQSNMQADVEFTDSPRIGAVTVGSQTGTLTYGTAGSATFSVATTRTQNGTVNGTFSVIGLPTGATATFVPATFTANGGNAFPNATMTVSTTASAPAGVYSITVRCADGGDISTGGAATLTIGPKHITGSFTAANKVYDGNNSATVVTLTLSGVVGGDNVQLTGGTATFNNKNVGTGKTVTLTGATLTGAAASNYVLDSVSTTTANITPKNLTISGAVANSKQYDGATTATLDFTGASLSGVISGDSVSINSSGYTANFNNKNVGTNKPVTVSNVTLSGTDAGNYTVSQPTGLTANITAKNLTINGAVAQNKVYDSNTSATVNFAGASLVGVNAPDVVTIISSGYTATFNNKNVGTGKPVTVSGVTLSGADAGSYTVSQPSGLTADITPKNLTINGAVAQDKQYNGNDSATVDFTAASLVGVINPDVVTISSSGYSAHFNNKNVGNNKPVTVSAVTLSGADAGNYTVSQPSGLTANITAKNLTINGSVAQNKVYDRSDSATVDFTSASLVGVVTPDVVSINSSAYTASFNNKNVGTGKPVTVTGVTSSGANAGNYTVSQPSGLTANITAKNLTINGAVAHDKQYDGNDSATVDFTGASLVGLINPDVVSINSSAYTATFNNKNVGSNKPVTVSGVTLSGADAGNYAVIEPSGLTANITAKNLTINGAVAQSKEYDGNTTATLSFTSATLVGVVSGDTVLIDHSAYVANFNNKTVGDGKPVTVSAVALSGADAGNYTVTQPAGLTADITARHLTISGAVAQNKMYDGSDAATVDFTGASLAVVVSGDAVTINSSGYTATFNTKNVGNAKPVTVSQVALSGADAGNYTLSQPSGLTANITAVTVTASIVGNPTKPYDGNMDATLMPANFSLSGLVSGESFTVTQTQGSYNSKDVAAANTVTAILTAANFTAVAGTNASNYNLPTEASGPGRITKANATVHVTPYTVTYDAQPHTATYTITGVNGEQGADVGTVDVSHTTHTNAGIYNTDHWTFTGTGNYNDISAQTITDTINKKDATWTTDPSSKTYGDADPNPLTTGSGSGFIAADNVTATYSRAPGENASPPTYQITATLSATPASALNNYIITNAGADFTINKRAATWHTNDASKTYGDADPAPLTTGSGTNFIAADNVTATYIRDAGENASPPTYQITATLSATPATALNNYIITNAGAEFTINKAQLTVTADDKSRTYGAANPPFTATITGFVNSETVAVVSGTPTFSGTGPSSTGTSAIGNYVITPALGSLSASNYDFTTFNNGTLTITRAHLAVKADDQSKTYDGHTFTGFTATITGFVNGQTVSVVTGAAGFSGNATTAVNAGSYTITPTVGSLSAANYDFTPFNNGTLTIYKAHLTVTADNKSKSYDGHIFSPFTATITGFVNSENSSVVTGSPQFGGNATTALNAGTYTTTPTIGSLTATNYDFPAGNFVNGSLTINKVHLTVTADDKTKVYNYAVFAPFTAMVSGFANQETASVVSGAAGFTGNATTAIDVGTYTITPTGGSLSATNYDFTNFTNGTLTITKANQTIGWTNPAAIIVGTPLSATQLNATVAGIAGGSPPGALTYTPPAGTVLPPGANQALKVDAAATMNYNPATKTVYINVNYTFVGFLQPIDNIPIVNSVKVGQTIPIKWQLKDASGNLISDLGSLAASGLQSVKIACDNGAPIDAVEELAAPGSTVFRFDGTQFIFNWQTTKSWTGTCRMMTVTLKDGNVYSAQFTFK